MTLPAASRSRRPLVVAVAALAAVLVVAAGATAYLLTGADKPPAVAVAAPSTSASSPPPLFTVARTWPAGPDGGAGATLIVAGGSEVEARAAIDQYLMSNPPSAYLWVEVLDAPAAETWTCSADYVVTEADKASAVHDGTRAIATFPGRHIECLS